MRARRTGRKQKRRGCRKLLILAVMILTAGSAAAFACFVKLTLEPNMEELAKIRAEVLVSRTVTRVLAEQFRQETSQEELFTVHGAGQFGQDQSAHVPDLGAAAGIVSGYEKRRVRCADGIFAGKPVFIPDRSAGADHGHSLERFGHGLPDGVRDPGDQPD